MSESGQPNQTDGAFELGRTLTFFNVKDLLAFLGRLKMDGVPFIEYKLDPSSRDMYWTRSTLDQSLSESRWVGFGTTFSEVSIRAIVLKRGPTRTDLKTDSNKPRYSMLPEPALRLISEVFGFGNEVKKYPLGNYRNRRPDETHEQHILRYIDAMGRHLFKAAEWYKFKKEHAVDDESGKLHLAHLGCCVMMALDIIDQYQKESLDKTK